MLHYGCMFAAPTPESLLVPPQESAPITPETSSEGLTSTEADRLALEKLQEEQSIDADAILLESAAHEPAEAPAPEDPLFKDIEKILAVDLNEFVKTELADKEVLRQRFLAHGRQLALDIYGRRASLKPEDMVHLVRQWLLQIPNVSKHFLAQDAYIKTQMLSSILQPKPNSTS